MHITPEIVIGFHGCDKEVFDKVIKNGEHLSDSDNDYDWLGQGKYFWEGSYERALQWAKDSSKINTPSVVGAFIKLGNCVDLLDSKYLKEIKLSYDILKEECNKLGTPLPQNSIKKDNISLVRELDCKVISRHVQFNNESIAFELGLDHITGINKRKVQNHPEFIDTIRGMFPEGKELYNGAGFRDKNHIQLCIINPNSIIGYFNPIQKNSWYKSI